MACLDAAPGVFILIPTHTTRHLAACLASLAHQTAMPAGVVVSCDSDDAAIGALLDEWWPRVCVRLGAVPLWHTFRAHQGHPRLNQVRNNGLRVLRDEAGTRGNDGVLVLDGDTMLAPDAVAKHAALRAGGAELVIPYRYMLDEATTAGVDAAAVLERGVDERVLAKPEEAVKLAARDRRYRKHLWLRRWGLTKVHKPKLLGGHHSAAWARLVEINGFDEEYVGHRADDDDLSRRLRSCLPTLRVAIAVRSIAAYHLWHPSRAFIRPEDDPGYVRWSRRDLPARSARGLDHPLEQPAPALREVAGMHTGSTATTSVGERGLPGATATRT